MKMRIIPCLLALAALVTGCPRNQYIVELSPRGDKLERQLTFYREDGTDTNGVPNYKDFPATDLAAIKALYPPGSVKMVGKRHVARAEFGGAMPKDVGGAGGWTNFATSMGKAAIYVERFRGDDDLATNSARRTEAVDQLVDLLIAWTKAEMGQDPRYEKVRNFFDEDLRRDLKNLSTYNWLRGVTAGNNPKADEEFAFRFGQYLCERGYLKFSQLPEFFAMGTRNNYQGVIIQRLLVNRLGLSASEPLPPPLAFLTDEKATEASLETFVETTDAYRARLKQWEEEKKNNPDANKPKPSELVVDLIGTALEWRMGGTDDHLKVKLSLPSEPIYTNGKWDATRRQVLWESDLDEEAKTPSLPVICYATWCEANKSFQEEHFGRAILVGEELMQYCLWRTGLNTKQADEWESFLTSLKPDALLVAKLDAFRFSDEPAASAAKGEEGKEMASAFARESLKEALTKSSPAAGK